MVMLPGQPARARPARRRVWSPPLVRAVACFFFLSLALAGNGIPPPAVTAQSDQSRFELGPSDLSAGTAAGVDQARADRGLHLAPEPLTREDPAYPRYGIAESQPIELPGPSTVLSMSVDGDTPSGSRAEVWVRALTDGKWSEWYELGNLPPLEGVRTLQTRVLLLSGDGAASPTVRAVRGRYEPWSGVRAAQVATPLAPTVTLMATRIGMVGKT